MDTHRSRRYRIAMADILTRIEAYKREEIAAAKRSRSRSAVEAAAKAAPPPRGFLAAIERRLAAGDYAPIAEIKKASPSKGLIPADFDPPAPARAYGARGAARLSVLPDRPPVRGAPGERPDRGRLRPAGAGAGLRSRRRRLPFGPDRRALVPRRAGASCGGARRHAAAGVAQGFHVRPLSGGRGARARRRLHPHYRGGAR